MIEKSAIHQICVEHCTGRIESLRLEMASLRESAASDTKSSMGDKYETSREMAQIELNKLGTQLRETEHSLALCNSVQPAKNCDKAEAGAMIVTDKMTFYLLAPLGKMKTTQGDAMVISTVSPAGKAMLGKSRGDAFMVNGNSFVIREIY